MSTATLKWPDGAAKYKDGKFYTLDGKPVGKGVAMDSVPTVSDADVAAKIRRAKAKLALNAAADRKVKALFPALVLSVAMDDKDAEEAVQGSFSSEDEDGNEATEEDNTFGAGYAASLKATRRYWDKVKGIKPSATFERVRNNNKPVAVDHVANNAKKAKSFSMFDSAKAIIRRQRKASK